MEDLAISGIACAAGKNMPLKAISGLLDAAGATDLRLGQVTSDSAIEWALKREPRQILLIFESLSRNDLRDGWLSRNLFFISRTRPKPEPKPLKPIPNAVLTEILGWKTPGPFVTVPTSAEARAVFAAFNDEIYERMLAA